MPTMPTPVAFGRILVVQRFACPANCRGFIYFAGSKSTSARPTLDMVTFTGLEITALSSSKNANVQAVQNWKVNGYRPTA